LTTAEKVSCSKATLEVDAAEIAPVAVTVAASAAPSRGMDAVGVFASRLAGWSAALPGRATPATSPDETATTTPPLLAALTGVASAEARVSVIPVSGVETGRSAR